MTNQGVLVNIKYALNPLKKKKRITYFGEFPCKTTTTEATLAASGPCPLADAS